MITASTGQIGREITGLELGTLDEERIPELQRLLYRHKLLVFRRQYLTPVEYIAVAQRFGQPQIYFQENYHHPDHPEIFVSANVPLDGKKVGVSGTGQYWHTDYQFMPEPLPLTMLYPQQIPAGRRETYYIDMERVLRELPPALRQHVDGKRAVHEGKYRYKVQPRDLDRSLADLLSEIHEFCPPVSHPAVIRHPITEAESLYMSEGFTTGIEGYSHEEARQALAALFSFIARPEHVHTHIWEEGDVLLWDNRQLLHQASKTAKGQASVSFRIGVYDGNPFYAAPPS